MQNNGLKRRWLAICCDEQGAVMIEFALWLPLIVIIMLFLILCYSIVEKSIGLTTEVYAELRRECRYIEDHFATEGPLRRVKIEKQETIVVQGALSTILQTSSIPLKASLVSYAGSFPGNGYSRYSDFSSPRYYWAELGGE
jgi:Flp pilus assembly pilin Flp